MYNGARNVDDEQTLLLSDSFPAGSDPDIEVRVRMVNINEAHSSPLMQRCQPLREYAWTVGRIREKMVGRDNDARLAVINGVVESMPDGFLIKPYLIAHKGEVVDMLLTEYDEAREMELLRQAYKEQFMVEGREEGREEGRIEGMVRMCQALGLTEAEAADRLAQALGISLELAEPKVRQHWQ